MMRFSEILTEALDATDLATLRSIEGRVNKRKFAAWLVDYLDNDALEIKQAMEDESLRLDYLSDFIDDEYGLKINGELIEFWKLENGAERVIGDLPVLLYHYTSSAIVPDILKHGLIRTGKMVNPYQNSGAGVYLTTEGGGRAIDGYVTKAEQGHGGEGVRVYVKCYLNEIEPDPDDADIASGAHQFIARAFPPDRILKIERYLGGQQLYP